MIECKVVDRSWDRYGGGQLCGESLLIDAVEVSHVEGIFIEIDSRT